jgi:hypothetical protein
MNFFFFKIDIKKINMQFRNAKIQEKSFPVFGCLISYFQQYKVVLSNDAKLSALKTILILF